MAEIRNDGVRVLSVEVHENGIALAASFPTDDRAHLSKVHQWYLGFDQVGYGADARDIVSQLEDLAFDLLHNHARQPREEEV
jgi:hypothetical protein